MTALFKKPARVICLSVILAISSIGLEISAGAIVERPISAASILSSKQPSASRGESDFERRCQMPGVVRCFGFDSPTATEPHLRTPWGVSKKRAIIDSEVRASGTGSLRFEIPQFTGSDTSGNFSLNFADDLGTQFGSGDEFYVQWRQRFSPELLTTLYKGANGWKQVIIGEGDRPGFTAQSCTQLELVIQNTEHRGFPQMYHSCGQKDGAYEPLQRWSPDLNDIVLQQGDVTCTYRDQKSPQCIRYAPNEWMTFQVHVKIGTWYQDDRTYHHDSTVQLWVAREGESSKLVIDFRPGSPQEGYDLVNTNPQEARYGKIWLLPYNSKKSATQAHATAYTWYDDLIISRRRIPDPSR